MSTMDLTLPPFNPADWTGYSFGEDGAVEIAMLDEEENIAASFTPERARIVGMRLIEMAREIEVTISNQGGSPAGLAKILADYDVTHTDEMFDAMRRKRIRNIAESIVDRVYGPEPGRELRRDPMVDAHFEAAERDAFDETFRNLD